MRALADETGSVTGIGATNSAKRSRPTDTSSYVVMGSFPSQEQAAHPSAPSGSDLLAASHHPTPQPTTRVRTSHALIKKLTRGRVLFLGLDGAGKSTIVTHLVDDEYTNAQSAPTPGEAEEELRSLREYPHPTKACHTATYRLEDGCYLQAIDVPGRRDFRWRWYTTALAPSDAPYYGSGANAQLLPLVGIVFVVDASDRVRFPVVADELIRFQKLKEHWKVLKKTQFFLLLNKTDQVLASPSSSSFASSPSETDRQKQELQAAHRTAMRAARRELKKCLDHQLRVDQRRHPRDYQRPSLGSVPAAPSGGISHAVPSAPPGGPLIGSKMPSAVSGHATSAAASPDVTAVRTTLLMTSILECCAHDRESIRAIHAWIKDEVKKVL